MLRYNGTMRQSPAPGNNGNHSAIAPSSHKRPLNAVEKVMLSIGSVPSLVLHTCFFSLFFIAAWLHVLTVDFALLVLTTVVSLEAIYMAIFIQMAVNRNTQSLYEVEEDIEEIQEDVGEIQEDVGEIQEDVAEVQENMDEIQEEILDEQEDLFGNKVASPEERGSEVTLDRICSDLERLLKDIEALKEKK